MSKIETNTVKPELSFMENEVQNLILDIANENSLDSSIQ